MEFCRSWRIWVRRSAVTAGFPARFFAGFIDGRDRVTEDDRVRKMAKQYVVRLDLFFARLFDEPIEPGNVAIFGMLVPSALTERKCGTLRKFPSGSQAAGNT